MLEVDRPGHRSPSRAAGCVQVRRALQEITVMKRLAVWLGMFAVALAPLVGVSADGTAPAAAGWKSLSDEQQIAKWKSTPFGGEGEVERADGVIRIGMGADLSGVTWSGTFPKQSYEIALDARRVDGSDFFCGLTFPVGEDFCSLILGGWGGAVVGLSSIDELDAAHNDTTQFHDFKKDRWYAVTLRVTPDSIECFLDGEPIIEQSLEGRKVSIRHEVAPSKPLGISTYSTTGEIRNIRWRPITADGPK
jgi:hypothetical protein